MSYGGNISEELLKSGRTCSRKQLVDGVTMDLASCSHSHPRPDACVCENRPMKREPLTV